MWPGEHQPISADGSPRGPDQFSRNSAYGTIAGLCTAIGSVLANVIVAHMLGVEGTGVIVFALWMAMLAAAVTDLGAQATLARYLPELTLAGRPAGGDRLTALRRSAVALARCAALAGFAGYGRCGWRAGAGRAAGWSAAGGLFSVGVTLANLASRARMLLTAGLRPYFAQAFGKGALAEMRDAYASATRVLAFLVFPACFGMAAVLPALLPMLYGRAFAGALPAATILVIGAGIGSAASVGTSLVMAVDRSDFIFLSGLVAAVLTVLAGFTAIPAFGLMGAVCARVAIQVSAVAFGGWFVFSRLGFPLPFRDLAKLLLAAGLCGAAARLCLLVPGAGSLPAAVLAGA